MATSFLLRPPASARDLSPDRWRWGIAVFLLLVSVLNYVDRQSLSLLIPSIEAELHLTRRQYGDIVSAFLLAYAAAYLVSGRLLDRWGARVSLGVFVGIWGVADLLTGLARSAGGLGLCRGLLGLGEAGGYVVSPKVVAARFSPRERGIAIGLYSAGASAGATLAPPLVVALAGSLGWRGVFFATGLAALALAAAWAVAYRDPLPEPAAAAEPPPPASSLLRCRPLWAVLGARMLTDPLWYFYLFWMPKYLHDVRGFDQHDLAGTWRIFAAADVGFLGCGFLAAGLIRRGLASGPARLRVMLGAAAVVPLSLLIPRATGNGEAVALAMAVACAHAAWLASLTAYAVDRLPPRLLGTAMGTIGAGSALGGMAMSQLVAWSVGRWSYAPCFAAMAGLHLAAWALIRLAAPEKGGARAA